MYASLIIRDGVETFASRDTVEQFSSFADYHDRMQKVLRALVANGKSALRKRPVQLVTNASRGYDSPAVTALVTELGDPVTSYSPPRSNSRIPSFLLRFMDADVIDDDGRDIAKQLGATPQVLDSDLTKIPGVLEKWIWASGQIAPELVFWRLLSDAAGRDALTIWFAGHFGDGMWATQPDPRALQGTLYRGAPSGYALAEARIYCGVVDCSLPYVFGAGLANVRKVSMSEEMAFWRLGNDYDRPIPRRLLEECGVDRKAFGFGKKAVAQDLDSPQGHELREAFFRETPWSVTAAHGFRLVNNVHLLGLASGCIYSRPRESDADEARGRIDEGADSRSGSRAGSEALHLRLLCGQPREGAISDSGSFPDRMASLRPNQKSRSVHSPVSWARGWEGRSLAALTRGGSEARADPSVRPSVSGDFSRGGRRTCK